ncbi:class I SAM-dependent methyltransferase [Geodermatophilus sp. SYSU D00758]
MRKALGARVLEATFGCPHGPLGRIGGRLMARSNAATERHLVDAADLTAEDVVLVVGPGPGVGLEHAALRAAQVIGVDPSEVMRRAARRRCSDLVARGVVRIEDGTAAATGQPDASVDVVLSVNNIHLWPDLAAGLAEARRVLRPGGRLLVSVHARWQPGGADTLGAAVGEAGLTDVRTSRWEPPGRLATTALRLQAKRPA